MRDFRDAKAMAHTLREALKLKSISVTHSESSGARSPSSSGFKIGTS